MCCPTKEAPLNLKMILYHLLILLLRLSAALCSSPSIQSLFQTAIVDQNDLNFDLDLGALPDIGTIQGRDISIPEAIVHVEETRGILVGRTLDTLEEPKERDTEDYGSSIETTTGKFTVELEPCDKEEAA